MPSAESESTGASPARASDSAQPQAAIFSSPSEPEQSDNQRQSTTSGSADASPTDPAIDAAVAEVIARGEIEVTGRLSDAS
ncbi:MAG: hypothetical protein ABWZ98_18990, partial [Nakamurella sp.]